MAGSSAGEKTEKATPKRKKDERKKGNVFSSNDFASALFIVVMFLTLRIFSKSIYTNLAQGIISFINMSGKYTELSQETVNYVFRNAMKIVFTVAGPAFIVGVLAPIIFTGIQTRFMFSMEAVKPKFSRLNPLSGFKKLFSMRAIVDLVKNLIKLAIISAIIYSQIKSRLVEIINFFDIDPKVAIVYLCSSVYSAVMTISIIFIFVGILDYGYQWWEYEKNLKMTKQEIKEEYKQMEGDPQIKGKIRQKQREMAQARMMADVPNADVVIRNPTHFAVAIKYDPEKNRAPLVLAKGADLIAFKIIEVASKHDITLTENRPLARALYDAVEIGQEIPEEFYHEVAEILAFVYDLKNKKLEY